MPIWYHIFNVRVYVLGLYIKCFTVMLNFKCAGYVGEMVVLSDHYSGLSYSGSSFMGGR